MDKEQYTKFFDAQIGSTINRPVLVSAIAENTARNGNTFVRVSLKDGFSEVTARHRNPSILFLNYLKT